MSPDEITSIARATGVASEDVERRHRAVQDALRFFTYEHLPQGTPRRVSAMFEAKDAAVRAAIAAVRETGDGGR